MPDDRPTPAVAPIAAAERAERAPALFARLPRDVDAVVLFDDQFVQYFTGFVFAATERPIAAVVGRDGGRTLFVPRLEREHAEAVSDADRVIDYPEYPGEIHPIDRLVAWLRGAGLANRRVGVDHDGYPPVMGYVPRPLSAHVDVVGISAAVDAQMAIKSDHEVALIRESVRWGAVAHRLLQDGTRVGLTEHEVVGAACAAASERLRAAMGPGYRQRNRWISGALAIYRGQIGAESAYPHALAADLRFAEGDTLVTGAGADIWGYLSEGERSRTCVRVQCWLPTYPRPIPTYPQARRVPGTEHRGGVGLAPVAGLQGGGERVGHGGLRGRRTSLVLAGTAALPGVGPGLTWIRPSRPTWSRCSPAPRTPICRPLRRRSAAPTWPPPSGPRTGCGGDGAGGPARSPSPGRMIR